MSAVIEANPAMVKALLAHAPDINAKNNDGRTSLHLATTSSLFADSGMLKILLQHGADTNIRDYSVEPLLNAVVRSRVHYVEDVQLLISYGADVNAGDRFGTTALHAAVKRRDIQVVDAILQHNANVNGRDIWGATPLMLAFPKWQTVSTELVEMLLKNGADVNAGEWSNTTALRIAVEAENAGLTKLLLIYGADGDSQKEGYRSIMDIARGRPNKEIEWLLTYFADVPPRARFEAARAIGYQER
jgi:ankyrin repeat protein